MSGREAETAVLRGAGFGGQIRYLADPVPTAQAAADVLGCPVGAIANSLLFRVADEPLLVLASGAARVDVALVAAALGTGPLRRASPHFVEQHTGQRVGGVSPVGHPRPLRTIVDVELAAHDPVWAGAGDEYSMFATNFEELLAVTAGTPMAVR